jgi:hypothetical protein
MSLIRQNKLPIFLAILALVACVASCIIVNALLLSGYLRSPTGIQQSVNTQGRFAISYPSNWYFLQSPGGQRDPTVVAAIVRPDILKLGVVISFRRSSVFYSSLDEVAKWGKEVAQSELGYEEIATNVLVVNGEETVFHEYTWFTPQTPLEKPQKMQCYGNYRLHNQVGFVITLCINAEDFSSNKSTFRQIINSFIYQD